MTRTTARLATLLSLSLLAAAAPLRAQAPAPEAPRALVITAQNLMAGDARHHAIAARGGDSSVVMPGDVVQYRLLFRNVTHGAIRGVVFNNPLPAGLRYDGGTAAADRNDVAIDYSVDGGKSFAAQPTIEVEVDGKRVERPAPPEMYTHIRWTVKGSVLPGATVRAEFRAHLAAPAQMPGAAFSAPRE
jgi:uncharacterized repeat protein (TIGR01451 family)